MTEALEQQVSNWLGCRPEAIADRYGLYRRLQREAPVLHSNGQILLSRYADIEPTKLAADVFLNGGKTNRESSELRQRYESLSSQQQAAMVAVTDFRSKWVTTTNGEDHVRLRMLAHRSFTPRVLAGIRNRIEETTEELVDKALSEGNQVDMISQFAWKLPMIIICEMLDVPEQSRDDIRRWSVDVASFSGGADYGEGLDAAYPSMFALKAHLEALFESRRGQPTSDLMGALLAAETEAGERFSPDELIGMFANLVFAGHETTTNLIGNGVYALLSHPEQWDRLRQDPDRAPEAVEEVLRFLSPVQTTKRVAAFDTEVAGVPIPKNQTVTMLLGAANRDPGQFEAPDTFDIGRPAGKHLAFGLGPHFCLGAALARMEGAIALRMFATRFPDMRLVSPNVTWRPNTTFCSLAALPVAMG
jgi:cytochrome P450